MEKKKSKGWVKVYREIMENDLWEDKPFARGQAWVDMIMLANHKDHEFLFNSTFLNVTPGTVVTSKRMLGERWGWSRTKVTKFLNELEMVEMISQKSDTKKTVIKLVNYEKYQGIVEGTGNVKEPQYEHQKNIRKTSKKHLSANQCVAFLIQADEGWYWRKTHKRRPRRPVISAVFSLF